MVEEPKIQILSCIIFFVLALGLTIFTFPFAERLDNILEIFNNICFLIILICFLIISLFQESLGNVMIDEYIGNSIIILLIILTIVNLFGLLISGILTLKQQIFGKNEGKVTKERKKIIEKKNTYSHFRTPRIKLVASRIKTFSKLKKNNLKTVSKRKKNQFFDFDINKINSSSHLNDKRYSAKVGRANKNKTSPKNKAPKFIRGIEAK